MAEKQIFEGGYDDRSVGRIENGNRQFDLLGSRIEKMKVDLSATCESFEYILKEINTENDNINKLLLWNQKRLNLLNEIGDKCRKLNTSLLMAYEEMYDCIKCNNDMNKIEI